MADWSLLRECYADPTYNSNQPYTKYQDCQQYNPYMTQAQPYLLPSTPVKLFSQMHHLSPPQIPAAAKLDPPKVENPREIRNKAEKQRRDKLNQSISELASMVPPVLAANRRIDKTGVLRLTAHYLRAHQYVFGDSISKSSNEISSESANTLLHLLNGFLLTTTYKGLVVVVSQNVQQFLGYTELDLLGHSIYNITHGDDHKILRENLMPKSHMLGTNGQLLVPDEPDGRSMIASTLANDKRRFTVRFKKLSQRTEPSQYVTCHIEGSLRKSDKACRGSNKCQILRRSRARGENPCSSGNDVVFIGIVRPSAETFKTESELESFRMEYRTRHSVDGEIIQCENRIALVTGYMMSEVNGVNAMNFMHRDDVRWVIIALRQMYDQHNLFGESCYRLMTKNGELIYMRTRGRLEVDSATKAVTSFMCTNTVVDEEEGKVLIRQMKKKFNFIVNNNDDINLDEEIKDTDEATDIPVEDPNQLKKIILHLVTNLPSPRSDEEGHKSPQGRDSEIRLAIIPPRKERIVSAIEKIYNVIKSFKRSTNMNNHSESLSEEDGHSEGNLIINEMMELDTVSNSSLPIHDPMQEMAPTRPSTPRFSYSPTPGGNCLRRQSPHHRPLLALLPSQQLRYLETPTGDTFAVNSLGNAYMRQQMDALYDLQTSNTGNTHYQLTSSNVIPAIIPEDSTVAACSTTTSFSPIKRGSGPKRGSPYLDRKRRIECDGSDSNDMAPTKINKQYNKSSTDNNSHIFHPDLPTCSRQLSDTTIIEIPATDKMIEAALNNPFDRLQEEFDENVFAELTAQETSSAVEEGVIVICHCSDSNSSGCVRCEGNDFHGQITQGPTDTDAVVPSSANYGVRDQTEQEATTPTEHDAMTIRHSSLIALRNSINAVTRKNILRKTQNKNFDIKFENPDSSDSD